MWSQNEMHRNHCIETGKVVWTQNEMQKKKEKIRKVVFVTVRKEPGSILDCPDWASAVKIAERRRKRKIVAIIYLCLACLI